MPRCAPLILVLLFPLTSCDLFEGPSFKVTMKVTDDGRIERIIAAGNAVDTPSGGKTGSLDFLAAIYGKPNRFEDSVPVYSRQFEGQLPADLNFNGRPNTGVFWINDSRLGRTALYIERMPGLYRPVVLYRELDEALSLLMEAFCAYAAKQDGLRDDPARLSAIQSFLKNDLHNDLMDMAMMTRRLGTAVAMLGNRLKSDEVQDQSLGAALTRAANLGLMQFLIEHQYLRADDVPAVRSLPSNARNNEVKRQDLVDDIDFEGLVIRRIGEILGCNAGDPLPVALTRFTETETRSEALDGAIALLSPEKQARLETLKGSIGVLIFDRPHGTVEFEYPVRPSQTNGRWDEKNRRVVWNVAEADAMGAPQVFSAEWIQPNESWQSEHFGRVLVDADHLADYIAIEKKLPTAEREAWSAFLDTLRPGEGLRNRLNLFRFQFDPVATAPVAPAAFLLKRLDRTAGEHS